MPDGSKQTWRLEWFNVQDRKHAVKLQEGGELVIDLKVNGDWEITKTEFTSDVSLRIIRMGVDPPGSPLYWRINISKGSSLNRRFSADHSRSCLFRPTQCSRIQA